MSDDYRLNVIMFLCEFVVEHHAASVLRETVTAYGDALLGRVSYAVIAPDIGAPRPIDLEAGV